MNTMQERLKIINNRINQAASSCNRQASEVTLIAVSKGHAVEKLEEAYQAGLRNFGESYVQELVNKQKHFAHYNDINWHFIGHLQSNKARYIATQINYLHSIDRIGIIEVLERLRFKDTNLSTPLPVLIELEVDSNDTNKHGVPVGQLDSVCQALSNCKTLRWVGFMGMGSLATSNTETFDLFQNFRSTALAYWDKWRHSGASNYPILSLGMSDDLELAIAAGSTMVRIGSALFGERA